MVTLKTLKAVENYLKLYNDKSFSRGHIRNELNVDANSLMEVLDYLRREGKVTTARPKRILKYTWI